MILPLNASRPTIPASRGSNKAESRGVDINANERHLRHQKRRRAAKKAAETRRRKFAAAVAAVGGEHGLPKLGRPHNLLPPAKRKHEGWCTCAFIIVGGQPRHEAGCPK